MARNLLKKGHQLVVYDINTQIANDLAKSGMSCLVSD
jgi:3-hydroxyisobutyrate dehydrogenase-like beta-hydroxyacid dehydrogenase